MGIVAFLYRLARKGADLQAISSGKPKRIIKRGKNKIIGRKLLPKIFKFPF